MAYSLAGQIAWPDLLLADEYRVERESLEKLFRERARGTAGGRKAAVHKPIGIETVKLHDSLNSHLKELRLGGVYERLQFHRKPAE